MEMGSPPPSRHEYEEVLKDKTDVIGEKNFEKMVYIQVDGKWIPGNPFNAPMKKGKKRKFDAKTIVEEDKQYQSEPEESVDCEEKMSSDDDDCEDSGEDDLEEGSDKEEDEFMREDKTVRDSYDNIDDMHTQEQEGEYVPESEHVETKKTIEDRRGSPIETVPIPPSPTTEMGIAVKSNSEEGHTHNGLNQPGIMDRLTSLEGNVEENKVVIQQTCANLRAEHKVDCSTVKEEVARLVEKSIERWQDKFINNLALNYSQIETRLSGVDRHISDHGSNIKREVAQAKMHFGQWNALPSSSTKDPGSMEDVTTNGKQVIQLTFF
ncbi:hypothetical protein Scep_002296 [Stephania cephalantha]|uniref:Uncharacterized protein n=1 Tax=Stephania cephalantha TaxID=152367 RepID=A0AAP0LAR4_9MAGN